MRRFMIWLVPCFIAVANASTTIPISEYQSIQNTETTEFCRCKITGLRVDFDACGLPFVAYDRPQVVPWLSVRQISEWMNLSCARPDTPVNEQLAACAHYDERIRLMYEHPVNQTIAAPQLSRHLLFGIWNWTTTNREPGIPSEEFGACPIDVDHNGAVELLPGVRGDMARVAMFLFDRYGVTLPPSVESALIELNRIDPPSVDELKTEEFRRDLQREYNPYVLVKNEFNQSRNRARLLGLFKAYQEDLEYEHY